MSARTLDRMEQRELSALLDVAALCVAAERTLLDPQGDSHTPSPRYRDLAARMGVDVDSLRLNSDGQHVQVCTDGNQLRAARWRTGDALRALDVRQAPRNQVAIALGLPAINLEQRLRDRNMGVDRGAGIWQRLRNLPGIFTGRVPSPLRDSTAPLDWTIGGTDRDGHHDLPLLPGRMGMTTPTWRSHAGDTARRLLRLPTPYSRASAAAHDMWNTPQVAAAVDRIVTDEVRSRYRKRFDTALSHGLPRIAAAADAAHLAYQQAVTSNVTQVVTVDALLRMQPGITADAIAAQLRGEFSTPPLNSVRGLDTNALRRRNGLVA